MVRCSGRLLANWLPAAVAGLVPIVWVPSMVDSFILPRATLVETGAGLLVAVGMLCGRARTRELGWALLACAVAATLAAVTSSSPAVSLIGTYSRYESLPMRLAYAGLCWGALRLAPPAEDGPAAAARWRDRVVLLFLLGCGVAAAEALVQAALGLLSRPDGNLGQPDLLGVLLAMALPCAAWRVRSSWRWAPLLALLGAGLLVSTSRAAWLGAVAGLATVFVLAAWRHRPRLGLAAAGAGVSALAAAVAVLLLTPLRVLNQDTGSARIGVWRDGVRLIAARPWLGWGEDTVGLHFGAFQTADWEPGDQFDRLHSMPLDLVATQGVLGLAVCTVLFVLLWRRLLRVPAAAPLAGALVAYLAWSLLDFDWAPATGPLWLLAGAALAGTLPAVQPAARTLSRHPVAAGGAALTLLAALAVSVPPFVADIASYAGSDRLAVAVDPLQPQYHAALRTPAQLREAIRLGSEDPQVWVELGDAEARSGHTAAARRAYQGALAIYPYDAPALSGLEALPPPARHG